MESLSDSIIGFIGAHAFWAGPIVALVTFGKSLPFVGILIPATTFLIAVGALAFGGALDLPWILGWAIPGAIAGNAVSYSLGVRFQASIPTWGPFRKRPYLLERSQAFFVKHGGKSILVARFFGPLRCTVPLTAGMMGMSPVRFYIVNVLSAIFWAPVVLAWGALVGSIVMRIWQSENRVLVLFAVGVAVLAGVLWCARARLARWLWGLAALLVLVGGPSPANAQSGDRCEVPAEFLVLGAPLPRTTRLLREGLPLTIVALGSSSTFGTGASDPAKSYPSRLEAELRQRFPGVPLKVVNRGVGGETESDMVARIDRDVLAENPDLVIWQVGANAVLLGDPTRADSALMRQGIDRLKASGADLMLMDLQYAPALMLRPRHRDMQRTIAFLAREEHVALFRRYAVMRYWAEESGVPLNAMLVADHLHMNDRSYGCLGGLVADSIAAMVGE